MNGKNKQFMVCGASGILIDENGMASGPFDQMVAGIRHIVKTFKHGKAKR